MTIKEVELQTGLTRSNIRFYEKEKLIVPSRNEQNGYRDYSEKDVEDLKKTAYLRTLGISIEEIRSVMSGKKTLYQVVEKQNERLEGQLSDLSKAKGMCEKMLAAPNISYEKLQVEQYTEELKDYWKDNPSVFQLDSVRFLYLWGSFATWAVITVLCFVTGALFYTKLPPEIPVQWSGGTASSLMDKKFIFTYPAACVVIRCHIRPMIYVKLLLNYAWGEVITEYLSNYLCFLILSVEIFSILFVFGVLENVVIVLLADTLVLIGLLAVGLAKKQIPFRKRKDAGNYPI